MGRHTDGSSHPERRPPRRRILLLSLGVTVTLVAWGVLVLAAIDLGRDARSGEPDAWTFLALATGGAAACLFVTLILGARVVRLVRGQGAPPADPPRPPRVPGGRRAAR